MKSLFFIKTKQCYCWRRCCINDLQRKLLHVDVHRQQLTPLHVCRLMAFSGQMSQQPHVLMPPQQSSTQLANCSVKSVHSAKGNGIGLVTEVTTVLPNRHFSRHHNTTEKQGNCGTLKGSGVRNGDSRFQLRTDTAAQSTSHVSQLVYFLNTCTIIYISLS